MVTDESLEYARGRLFDEVAIKIDKEKESNRERRTKNLLKANESKEGIVSCTKDEVKGEINIRRELHHYQVLRLIIHPF